MDISKVTSAFTQQVAKAARSHVTLVSAIDDAIADAHCESRRESSEGFDTFLQSDEYRNAVAEGERRDIRMRKTLRRVGQKLPITLDEWVTLAKILDVRQEHIDSATHDEIVALVAGKARLEFRRQMASVKASPKAKAKSPRKVKSKSPRPLTPKQIELAESVMRHDKDFAKAAEELGVSRQHVEHTYGIVQEKLSRLGDSNARKPKSVDPSALDAGIDPVVKTTKRQRKQFEDD